MQTKLRGMISLSAKAGKIRSGADAVRAAARRGEAALLLADASASANTRNTMDKLAAAYALPLLYVQDLGACIGKPGRTMAALCDEGFAKAIARINDEHGGVEGE